MSRISGTHYAGPLLGSDRAAGGLFEDVPLAQSDWGRSPYKTFVENFDTQMADGQLELRGATVTDINTATTPTEVITGAAPYLLINPGTKADSGTEVQFNAALNQGATTPPPLQTVGPMTSSTTLMLGRELFWYSRVGLISDATVWDGKAIMGLLVTDTSLMVNTDGLPSVATGGGFCFHIGEDGVLTAFCALAISAATFGTSSALSTGITIGTTPGYTLTANTPLWITLGFRARWDPTTITIGTAKFYINDRFVGTITKSTGMPISTASPVYSVSYGVHNGPAQLTDLAVSNVITGITRPGLTYPYTGL